MRTGYTDPWGYEQKITDLSDWSEFEPWQYWSAQFEWIRETDIQEQDIVAFRDNVRYDMPDRSALYTKASRFIIARIAGIVDNDVYLEVIHSEGENALFPEDKIRRGKGSLFQYGLYRWPRDRCPTENVDPDRKGHGREIKPRKEPTSRYIGSGKKSSGGLSSIFCGVARPKAKKKPFPHTLQGTKHNI